MNMIWNPQTLINYNFAECASQNSFYATDSILTQWLHLSITSGTKNVPAHKLHYNTLCTLGIMQEVLQNSNYFNASDLNMW